MNRKDSVKDNDVLPKNIQDSNDKGESDVIKTEVHVMNTGNTYDVEFPSSWTVGELISALVYEFNLIRLTWCLAIRSNKKTVWLKDDEVVKDILNTYEGGKLFLQAQTLAG